MVVVVLVLGNRPVLDLVGLVHGRSSAIKGLVEIDFTWLHDVNVVHRAVAWTICLVDHEAKFVMRLVKPEGHWHLSLEWPHIIRASSKDDLLVVSAHAVVPDGPFIDAAELLLYRHHEVDEYPALKIEPHSVLLHAEHGIVLLAKGHWQHVLEENDFSLLQELTAGYLCWRLLALICGTFVVLVVDNILNTLSQLGHLDARQLELVSKLFECIVVDHVLIVAILAV